MNRSPKEFTIRLTCPPLSAEEIGTDKSADFCVDLPSYVSLLNTECALLQSYISPPDEPHQLDFRLFHPQTAVWEEISLPFDKDIKSFMRKFAESVLGLFLVAVEENGNYSLTTIVSGAKLHFSTSMTRVMGFGRHDGLIERVVFKPAPHVELFRLIECGNLLSNATTFNTIHRPILGVYPDVARGLYSEPTIYFPVSNNTTNRLFFRILDEDGTPVKFRRRRVYLHLNFRPQKQAR